MPGAGPAVRKTKLLFKAATVHKPPGRNQKRKEGGNKTQEKLKGALPLCGKKGKKKGNWEPKDVDLRQPKSELRGKRGQRMTPRKDGRGGEKRKNANTGTPGMVLIIRMAGGSLSR